MTLLRKKSKEVNIMKHGKIRVISIVASVASFAFADLSQSIFVNNNPIARMSVGSPSFTDITQYNSYDFYNSPLGLFEIERARAKVNLNYLHLDKDCTVWNLPKILVGSPKSIYMQLLYAPSSISVNAGKFYDPLSKAFVDRVADLDLKRFGLTIAGQVPSGIFQMAFRGNGYVGNETLDGSPNSRLMLGLEALTVSVGSRIGEMVGFGVEGGISAKLDTLLDKRDTTRFDRYFEGQLPVIGGYIDLKKEGLPVASAMSFSIGTSRFVYVTDTSVDKDPLQGDSLAWRWQTIGTLASAGIVYHPALFLGYWKNSYQQYAPTKSNNDLNVGDERTGHDWKISDFCFGTGFSIDVAKYAVTNFEYAHSAMDLTFGNAWPSLKSKDAGYNRFSLGAEGALHSVSALQIPSSVEAFIRAGYFNQTENSSLNTFESGEFGLLNTVGPDSRTNRYDTTSGFGQWGQSRRVRGITFGLGTTLNNRMFSLDYSMSFLAFGNYARNSRFEFGIDCGYCFK